MTQKEGMICPTCGVAMNHHADKIVFLTAGEADEDKEAVLEFYCCPRCGRTDARSAEALG